MDMVKKEPSIFISTQTTDHPFPRWTEYVRENWQNKTVTFVVHKYKQREIEERKDK